MVISTGSSLSNVPFGPFTVTLFPSAIVTVTPAGTATGTVSYTHLNSISRSDLIVTILYAPKILTMAWNTSSISNVPSTSAKTPAFL